MARQENTVAFGASFQETFVASAEERALANEHRVVLMSAGRADSHPARAVYEQLLEDYPARDLAWVLAGNWRGPVDVPLDKIDFSTRASWTASKDGRVEKFAKKLENPIIWLAASSSG